MAVKALIRRVAAFRTNKRPHNSELVHALGKKWHVFADVDSRNVRTNGLKLSSILDRSVGLQVNHVLMGRPAGQEDHDDRLVLAVAITAIFCLKQLGQ